MSKHNGTVEVDRPVRVVYDQWTQFESFPEFMNGVEEVRQIDDSHNHWKVSIAGVEREFDTVIVEQQPDAMISWASTEGSNVAGEVRFEAIDAEHTRIDLTLDFEPSGFVETAGDKLGIVEAQRATDLRRFKEFIESRETPTGAWRESVDDGSTGVTVGEGDSAIGEVPLTGRTAVRASALESEIDPADDPTQPRSSGSTSDS